MDVYRCAPGASPGLGCFELLLTAPRFACPRLEPFQTACLGTEQAPGAKAAPGAGPVARNLPRGPRSDISPLVSRQQSFVTKLLSEFPLLLEGQGEEAVCIEI